MRTLSHLLPFLMLFTTISIIHWDAASIDPPKMAITNRSKSVPVAPKTVKTVYELIAGLSSNSRLHLVAGEYMLPQTITMEDVIDLELIGSEGTVIKGDTRSLLRFKGTAKNITISNISFISTSTSKSNDDGSGLVYFDLASSENLRFENCSFTAPNAITNGLKFVNEGTVRSSGILVNQCKFQDIGRMAIEAQNHTHDGVVRLTDITVNDCDFKNLGLQSPFGMAISLSGTDQGAVLSKNRIADAKRMGIEITGWQNVLITDNIFTSENSEYQAISVQKAIGTQGYLNQIEVIGNEGSSKIKIGKFHNLGFTGVDGLVYSANNFDTDFLGAF